MDKVDSDIGQQLRRNFGQQFALVCAQGDGDVWVWADCTGVPRRVSRADWRKVAGEMVRNACDELGIAVPHLNDEAYRCIFSASGWLCREGRRCRECSERHAFRSALGGRTIAEFVAAK